MASRSPSIVVVRESFIGRIGKDEYEFNAGDLVDSSSPAVAKWPDAFEAPVLRYPVTPQVEQATAAPGEKRRR
jgi:hypothetical protein